ncbi:MAG: 2-dehydropantoate 2-reductase [Armatimonadetes bacterium RBG_16_67_12]|nr:MAG: 2-dehydropantoate 2-reductase [Armatimonadetes bacterium RBG_16_67_12]
MRIVVFGSGSVGGYFGGILGRAGEDVVFIARGEHLRAIQARGLRVDSPKGDFVVHPACATDDPAQAGPADVIIVGVKTWQVADAAAAMKPMLGPDTVVVPLQNGVEAPAQLAAALGAGHVVGGLCRIICMIAGPGHIKHLGGEPTVVVGELDRQSSERTERLRLAFERAGAAAKVASNIHVALWEKFLFLAPWSGLGALTRAPIGAMLDVPQTRQLFEAAMAEIAAVARARGIALEDDVVSRYMRFLDGAPPDGTASMQRDIIAGRPSELESQSGAVVRLGREVGVPTPVHAFIHGSLLPMELRARGVLPFLV